MLASNLSFKTAVLFALGGFAMGIAMAASHNHAVMPSHAHLTLLGWVSLFLFGFYYRLHPEIDCKVIARVQVLVWSAGTLLLAGGVALIYSGHSNGEIIAAMGSVQLLVALLGFAVLVFRRKGLAGENSDMRTVKPSDTFTGPYA
jgi:FtsH-binding integral membrane protein